MKNIEFEEDFMVFLYAYLIQLNLSLDRSRWTMWKELEDYYSHQIDPILICNYLESIHEIPVNRSVNFPLIVKSRIDNIKDYLTTVIFKKVYLSNSEVLFCYEVLKIFHSYLQSTIEIDKYEIETFRIRVSEIASKTICNKLRIRDRINASKVEHFLQNSILKCKDINSFLSPSLKKYFE
jgi:hypothetical protein